MHVRQVINEQVIDGIAIGHAELRVEGLANCEAGDIVGDEILQKRQCARSLNLEFAHVADVEEAGAGAYCFVFLQNTTVLYGHLPAAKLYKPCTQCTMLLVKGCAFQLCCCRVLCCHADHSAVIIDRGYTYVCLTISDFRVYDKSSYLPK